ncbi:MAG: hypothetical protein JSR91_02680 [Proteobacteria bacterium]|nr:hypothetical protein [Pseudomonadota bacterium]
MSRDHAQSGSQPGSRTPFVNAHHERIAGESHDDHLSAITHSHKVVADLL